MSDKLNDDDNLPATLDAFNAAAQGMSGVLQAWVRGLDAADLGKLDALMARGIRPGLLLIATGEGLPPDGAIVLVDQAGGLERAARITFTTNAITWN